MVVSAMKLFLAAFTSLLTAVAASPRSSAGHHAIDFSSAELQYYQLGAQPSIVNCTWLWYNASLDNFAPGLPNGGATYQQRYCLYDKYWDGKGPIFFYTGNESPVEEVRPLRLSMCSADVLLLTPLPPAPAASTSTTRG